MRSGGGSWKLESNFVKTWKLEANSVKSWKLEAEFGKIWKLEADLEKNVSWKPILKNLRKLEAFFRKTWKLEFLNLEVVRNIGSVKLELSMEK